MHTRTLLTLLVTALYAPALAAQAPETADPELAPLARMIGGTWHLGEDSYHSFAWGIGGRSITSVNYFVPPDGPKQVSEMMFLYHPGTDDDHYEWTLYQKDDAGAWVRRFDGTFERRR
jgi:hypothetical protein